MFSQACVILFTGGCLPQCILGYHTLQSRQTPPPSRYPPSRADTPPGADPLPLPRSRHPPWEQTPPWADTPRGRHPPEQTPPQHRACWEIWSTRGWYASYWNAILFYFFLSRITFLWPLIYSGRHILHYWTFTIQKSKIHLAMHKLGVCVSNIKKFRIEIVRGIKIQSFGVWSKIVSILVCYHTRVLSQRWVQPSLWPCIVSFCIILDKKKCLNVDT